MIQRILFPVILMMFFTANSRAQDFTRWFGDGAARIDLVMAGDAGQSEYFLEKVSREPYFSGSRKQLLDPFDYGDHMFRVLDRQSGEVIFSHTFCTLFFEWQTTAEAKETSRAFTYSARFPWPKYPVILEISDRKPDGLFEKKYSYEFDPESYDVEPYRNPGYVLKDIRISGTSENKVDLLFIAEGYTEEEMDKFFEDAKRLSSAIFEEEPFNSRRSDFNIRALGAVSEESGTDLPGKGIWKNTVLDSRYYTFGSERYLTTDNYWKVCDLAAAAPCDHVIILVNSAKYGGGGIYNFYSMVAVDDGLSSSVLRHEFGHGFAGLADEYFESSVAYESYFPLDVEPWNPNLTTLVHFERKWKNMIAPGVPVPTPVDGYDNSVVGAFEGGGYVSKGVYRCRMRVNNAVFCPVCSRAIEDMIFRYTR